MNDAPLVALVDPIYDCLFRLAQPDALMNEEEVRCISTHTYLKVNFLNVCCFGTLTLFQINVVKCLIDFLLQVLRMSEDKLMLALYLQNTLVEYFTCEIRSNPYS